MKKHEILQLFPIPLYISSIDVDDETIIHLKREELQRLPIDNGDTSVNKYILSQNRYQSICDEIMRHVEIYVRDELFVNPKIKFKFTNSWIMRHKRGDYSHKHNHNNSVLSGIVYLDVSSESGDIHFERSQTYVNLFPPTTDLEFTEHNSINAKEIIITPTVGQILIFPSHLEHSVKISKSDNYRYCLVFNLFPYGLMGDSSIFNSLELS